jgi:hypothetical protein
LARIQNLPQAGDEARNVNPQNINEGVTPEAASGKLLTKGLSDGPKINQANGCYQPATYVTGRGKQLGGKIIREDR